MTQVSPVVRYIKPDGTLTVEGLALFAALLRMFADHEARLVAGGL
jgi:hypothetical protein